MRRTLAIVLLLALGSLSLVASGAGAETRPQLLVDTPTPVISIPSDQRSPDVFGDIVVWADRRNSATTGWDIYMFDYSTGVESPVCTANGDQKNPAIFGKLVAWEDERNTPGASDIYAKNLAAGVEMPICVEPRTQHQVQIFGDKIIWKDWRNDFTGTFIDADVYMYDMFDGSTTAVCFASGNQGEPAIYGDTVVWRDDRSTFTSSDIYIEDLAVGVEAPISTPFGNQWYPRVYEDLVVWQDGRAATHAIWSHDLSDGTDRALSPIAGSQYSPVPFGGAVVWTRQDVLPAGPADVSATDLSTGLNAAITANSGNQRAPEIHGNLVVWEDEFSPSNGDVYVTRLSDVAKQYDSLAGPTRYDTAAAASSSAYRTKVPVDYQGHRTVVIATGRNWPDALGATALAGTLDAPVLIVQPGYIPQAVKNEITRLGATRAIIVGGQDVVAAPVEAELAGIGVATVEREFGVNRYETANAVARRVAAIRAPLYDGVAFLATGGTFPDALAASPIAAAKGWPIFLVGASGLSQGTLDAMSDIGVTELHILGGSGAVSTGVEMQLRSLLGAGNVTRQEGATRYETAAAVASFGVDRVGLQWDTLAIATGEDFPDALSGGAVQARTYSILLLTRPDALPSGVQSLLAAKKDQVATARFLGGESAVSSAVRAQVAATLK